MGWFERTHSMRLVQDSSAGDECALVCEPQNHRRLRSYPSTRYGRTCKIQSVDRAAIRQASSKPTANLRTNIMDF